MAVPSNLTLSISGTNVILTWVNNPNICDCDGEYCDEYDNSAVLRATSVGGTYSNISGVLSGTATTYTDTTTSANTTYWYKVIVDDCDGCTGPAPSESCTWKAVACAPKSITRWADTIIETLNLSDNVSDSYGAGTVVTEVLTLSDSTTSDALAAVDTITETLTLSDIVSDSFSLRTDYGYFLGSSDGELYAYSPSTYGDATQSITSYWRSKTTDFSEQYQNLIDNFYTVYGARLWYVDKAADTEVTVYYSTDGGASWTSGGTNTVGDADGTTKKTDFYFIATGEYFDFKIEHASSSNDFQWTALQILFLPAGPSKEIS